MNIAAKVSFSVAFFLACLYFPAQVWGKTFYLDGNLSSSCVGSTYSTANRNCSGSDGQGYKTLQEAVTNLAGSDTLHIRSGTYIRTTNNTRKGSLAIDVSGTSGAHTVVRAYTGEQPVICTETGRCQYNPSPDDRSVTNCNGTGGQGGAACYYPNPAISIGGNFVDVIGLKTFGQLLIGAAHDVLVEANDLGGGGPAINQGSVVLIDNNSQAYNLTIRNNYIHHSAWGESNANSAALMGYNFSATIENNEFYDNWSVDIRLKDTGSQIGRTTYIRNNFFRPSTIFTDPGIGVMGCNQDCTLDNVEINNNIFLQKRTGISWESSAATKATTAFNNTFINCTDDIFVWQASPAVFSFNNVFYHSTSSQKFYYFENPAYPVTALTSNWNNFYTTAGTQWRHGNSTYSTLSAWQSGSGKDENSIASNPNFVNASGTRAEHFKRTSYPHEVSGSKYGTVTGAYETGNEMIGVSLNFSPPAIPIGPTGLTLR
jgi:hypothetical protein